MKVQDDNNLKFIGTLKTTLSTELTNSRLGVGFECLDREMWEDA